MKQTFLFALAIIAALCGLSSCATKQQGSSEMQFPDIPLRMTIRNRLAAMDTALVLPDGLTEEEKVIYIENHVLTSPIADKALVTHAGVTKEWYKKYFGAYHSEPLSIIAKKINRLWHEDKQAFSFEVNVTEWNDRYGTSPTHSPVWIRPDVLVKHDLFAGTDILQIIGHSQTGAGVTKDHNIICVDCLGTREKSYLLEL